MSYNSTAVETIRGYVPYAIRHSHRLEVEEHFLEMAS